MKKLFVPFALSVLMITGCSQGSNSPEAPNVQPADAESESVSPSATPSASAGEKSTRGNLIKQMGEGAGLTSEDEQVVSFVVNSIAVDVPCTGEYAEPAVNGHLMVLDVSIVTEPELADAPDPTFQMNPYFFTEIAPNGTTSNADLATSATYSCLGDAEVLPQMIGPGENVTGKLVLDVTNPSGTLVFKYGGAPAGWEWAYPSA